MVPHTGSGASARVSAGGEERSARARCVVYGGGVPSSLPCSPLKEADEDAYYETFKRLANSFYDSTITERSVTQTYLDIILNGAKFGFVFPSDLLLQAKALTTAEALAFTLTPDLKFDREARPIIAREFAQRAADLGRLRAQAEQLLPELLLFGELLPASMREPSPDGFSLPFGWSEILKQISEQVKASQPDIASLLAGQSKEGATSLIYDMGGLVYTKMGEVPWTMAAFFSQDAYEKARFATAAFRQFPLRFSLAGGCTGDRAGAG